MTWDPDYREREADAAAAPREVATAGQVRAIIEGTERAHFTRLGPGRIAVVFLFEGEKLGFTLGGAWGAGLEALAETIAAARIAELEQRLEKIHGRE